MPRNVSQSAAPPRLDLGVVSALTELGFSQYEARTYAGLIGRGPMTGYAVAKETQVPQPKVYETLGRLVERGAVVQVSDSPANFIAVSPARVLSELESSFRQRLSTVELEISRMRTPNADRQDLRPYQEATSWISIVEQSKRLIANAQERLYLSGHAAHLETFEDVVSAADRRGVRIDVLCFGDPPFEVEHGTVLRHGSTDGVVYRHHQARYLALTADSSTALWALAPEGDDWEAVWSADDVLLTALVKGFVRHDLFAQRMYHDFRAPMQARYGSGLEGLVTWADPKPASADESTRSTKQPATPRRSRTA
jgi:sugar-specific transcriptional regulator TrmB